MERRNLILSLFAIGCFIATATLIPGLSTAQADKVKAAMADLKARTEKLGAAKVEGSDLYFGTTKASNDIVDAVVKAQGGAASLLVKSGGQYVRVATTLKQEDGTSAVGTPMDPKSPGLTKLNNGEAYYGDAPVLGKTYDSGYEPIKDASGVIGAYWVGQQK